MRTVAKTCQARSTTRHVFHTELILLSERMKQLFMVGPFGDQGFGSSNVHDSVIRNHPFLGIDLDVFDAT